LHKVGIKIVIREHGAAHRSNADGLFAQAHFIEHFGDQAVCHTVGAAGTIMGGNVSQ
jgi:hypothetical protein